jgi:RNA polymerase sigma-70 factor (ECF subfamily)
MTIDDAAIERLVAEARSGDTWAFGMIFDHYHEAVYRFIASRVQRPTDAEDLTQLVFVKALEALPRYEARGVPFGGWLFRLARNTVIDHVRTRHDHAELTAAVGQAHGDSGPDEIAVVRQELDAVGAALATLTDEQREAIELRFFAGLSAREAAEAMGKQEGTVRGLQFRAIAALRRELGIDRPTGDASTEPASGGRSTRRRSSTGAG